MFLWLSCQLGYTGYFLGVIKMPRYIDAEKLAKIINPYGLNNPLMRLQDIMRAIAITPTADAALVVHAHWIIKQHEWDFGDPTNDYIDYTCSNCKIRLDNDTLFCPYCGAKMDEE